MANFLNTLKRFFGNNRRRHKEIKLNINSKYIIWKVNEDENKNYSD